METLSIIELTSAIAAGFGIMFFLGLILAVALPEQPGTYDYATGGMPQTFTLWMMFLGALGLFIGYLVLHCLGAFDGPEIKYKKLEIEVPESIEVDARFYQDSQEIHRESL
jgi:hypothetical protein